MPTAELEGALARETMVATTAPLLIFSGISTWRSYHCGGAISRAASYVKAADKSLGSTGTHTAAKIAKLLAGEPGRPV